MSRIRTPRSRAGFIAAAVLSILTAAAAHGAPQTGKLLLDYPGRCSIYVPTSALAGREVPILVCLPGRNIKSSDDIQHWIGQAEESGLLLIDVELEYAMLKEEEDLHALQSRIERIVDRVAADYPVSRTRVFIAGSSAGGVTAIALSLRYPDYYRAIGALGGGVLHFKSEGYLDNADGGQYYVVHGRKDHSIPIENVYTTVRKLEGSRAFVKFIVMLQEEHSLPKTAYRDLLKWFYSEDSFISKFNSNRTVRFLRRYFNLGTAEHHTEGSPTPRVVGPELPPSAEEPAAAPPLEAPPSAETPEPVPSQPAAEPSVPAGG